MAKTMNVTLLLVLVIAAATVLPETQAAQYVVGDTSGWTPSNGAAFYSTWASKHNFSVGDILVFNFTTGQHDVATVSKAAFDACTTTNTLSIANTGPANIPLNTTGENYFICTFASHCSAGQKLAVNVQNSSGNSTTPPPPAGSVPLAPPPPPTSSASSLAATFLLILMTSALTIFFLF